MDITEQIPFDLPESWSWARGLSVFMPMESTKPSSDFVYIDVDAVNNRLNIIDNPKKVRFENAPSRATRKLHKNDLLFSMVRPYLKNIALVDDIYRCYCKYRILCYYAKFRILSYVFVLSDVVKLCG